MYNKLNRKLNCLLTDWALLSYHKIRNFSAESVSELLCKITVVTMTLITCVHVEYMKWELKTKKACLDH